MQGSLSTRPPHFGNVLEALPEVWLHCSGVLGLREDLQELIVREEVEARKSTPLGLQVLTQPLLDLQGAGEGGGGGTGGRGSYLLVFQQDQPHSQVSIAKVR